MNGFLGYGQKLPTFDVVTGFGFTDAFHLGIKVHFLERNQIGIYYGNNLNLGDGSYNSFSLDHQLHFGKTSDFSSRKVWFLRQGLTYSIENDYYSEFKYLFLSFSIGREINISPKVGISIDLGLFHTLQEKERVKVEREHSLDNIRLDMKDFFVLPNLRIQFFYSF